MLGRLRAAPRALVALALALVCPHPVSFREGGYLPLASLLDDAAEEPSVAAMVLLCTGVYAALLFAASYLLFRSAPAR